MVVKGKLEHQFACNIFLPTQIGANCSQKAGLSFDPFQVTLDRAGWMSTELKKDTFGCLV